jgi:hypothetical protein
MIEGVTLSKGPKRVGDSPYLTTERNTVFERCIFLGFRVPDVILRCCLWDIIFSAKLDIIRRAQSYLCHLLHLSLQKLDSSVWQINACAWSYCLYSDSRSSPFQLSSHRRAHHSSFKCPPPPIWERAASFSSFVRLEYFHVCHVEPSTHCYATCWVPLIPIYIVNFKGSFTKLFKLNICSSI